ncbi:MAG: metallophosphoesterase [Clostridiaceae bacterium]|jgi:Icc-related predicted phosphoesterase|nr:metallophosphoesterase [Bacillota bacterium]NLI39200.1 metallophosphoesterase [Clostridiaceae bacterium]
MRILAVSDTESEYIWDHFDESRFEGVDLMISCGDLKSQYLSFLITMIKAPLFYVHGNHDTNYVDNAPEGCDCIEDKIVEYKGIRIIGLGGSMKYNSHPYNSVPPWQYTEKQMAKRVRKLERKIKAYKGFDIMVTHAPAYGIADDEDLCHTGFKCFVPLLDKYQPRLMIHGHMHRKFGRAPRSINYNGIEVVDAFGYHLMDI